jgi:hypothetical protein
LVKVLNTQTGRLVLMIAAALGVAVLIGVGITQYRNAQTPPTRTPTATAVPLSSVVRSTLPATWTWTPTPTATLTPSATFTPSVTPTWSATDFCAHVIFNVAPLQGKTFASDDLAVMIFEAIFNDIQVRLRITNLDQPNQEFDTLFTGPVRSILPLEMQTLPGGAGKFEYALSLITPQYGEICQTTARFTVTSNITPSAVAPTFAPEVLTSVALTFAPSATTPPTTSGTPSRTPRATRQATAIPDTATPSPVPPSPTLRPSATVTRPAITTTPTPISAADAAAAAQICDTFRVINGFRDGTSFRRFETIPVIVELPDRDVMIYYVVRNLATNETLGIAVEGGGVTDIEYAASDLPDFGAYEWQAYLYTPRYGSFCLRSGRFNYIVDR